MRTWSPVPKSIVADLRAPPNTTTVTFQRDLDGLKEGVLIGHATIGRVVLDYIPHDLLCQSREPSRCASTSRSNLVPRSGAVSTVTEAATRPISWPREVGHALQVRHPQVDRTPVIIVSVEQRVVVIWLERKVILQHPSLAAPRR